MELVKFRMEKCRFLYNSMEFEYGFVWNYEYLYVNYVCMELVKLCMEKYRFSYTSMKTMCVWKSSFGLESLDTWVGTLYFVYGLGLETPKPISY